MTKAQVIEALKAQGIVLSAQAQKALTQAQLTELLKGKTDIAPTQAQEDGEAIGEAHSAKGTGFNPANLPASFVNMIQSFGASIVEIQAEDAYIRQTVREEVARAQRAEKALSDIEEAKRALPVVSASVLQIVLADYARQEEEARAEYESAFIELTFWKEEGAQVKSRPFTFKRDAVKAWNTGATFTQKAQGFCKAYDANIPASFLARFENRARANKMDKTGKGLSDGTIVRHGYALQVFCADMFETLALQKYGAQVVRPHFENEKVLAYLQTQKAQKKSKK